MNQYRNLLRHILDNGTPKDDRTGTGTLSVFGYQTRFDLSRGFPLITTKKLHIKSIIYELLWFLNGDTNVRYLNDNGVTIWNEWADDNGALGAIYGKQWRNFGGVDQISQVLEQIQHNPDSRRHIVSTWNVGELDKMALPPCHLMYQFYVVDGKLSTMFYMRSCDVFLGLPFNIASYALLTHMVAQQCGLDVGELIFTGGDCHLYSNHIEQAKTQLERKPYPLPELRIKRKPADIFSYEFEDFEILNYQAHPHIKAKVAV